MNIGERVELIHDIQGPNGRTWIRKGSAGQIVDQDRSVYVLQVGREEVVVQRGDVRKIGSGMATSSPRRRLNPSMAVASPSQVSRLQSAYEAWHWGAAPDKVLTINDPYFPHCVGIGELRSFEIGDDGQPSVVLKVPKGSWIAFDPEHPGERLYTALTPAYRDEVRNAVKHAKTRPIQELAEATGGDQRRWKLPNIHGAPLGVLQAVIYHTYKKGEDDDLPSEYHHQFGEQWSKGIKPILAGDVSGRLWVCGGSYRCPNAGISG